VVVIVITRTFRALESEPDRLQIVRIVKCKESSLKMETRNLGSELVGQRHNWLYKPLFFDWLQDDEPVLCSEIFLILDETFELACPGPRKQFCNSRMQCKCFLARRRSSAPTFLTIAKPNQNLA
jgi:hypothetical protein